MPSVIVSGKVGGKDGYLGRLDATAISDLYLFCWGNLIFIVEKSRNFET